MKFFFDARLKGDPAHLASDVIPLLMRAVHHQRYREHDIAVAFPELQVGKRIEEDGVDEPRKLGSVIRFFANQGSLKELVSLMTSWIRSEAKANLVTITLVVPCPETDQWVAYTRFRIPPRRRGKQESPWLRQNRLRRRAELLARQPVIPFVVIEKSESGKQRFTLGIQPKYTKQPGSGGGLNGYGLSSDNNPVWLPNF